MHTFLCRPPPALKFVERSKEAEEWQLRNFGSWETGTGGVNKTCFALQTRFRCDPLPTVFRVHPRNAGDVFQVWSQTPETLNLGEQILLGAPNPVWSSSERLTPKPLFTPELSEIIHEMQHAQARAGLGFRACGSCSGFNEQDSRVQHLRFMLEG